MQFHRSTKDFELRTKPLQDLTLIRPIRVSMKETVPTLNDRTRTSESLPSQLRGNHATMCSPPGMKTFGPGSLGQKLHGTPRLTSSDPHGTYHPSLFKAHYLRGRYTRSKDSARGRWMEPSSVMRFRSKSSPQASHDFVAQDDCLNKTPPRSADHLACGQSGGEDHDAWVERSLIMDVIHLNGMRGGAIRQSRIHTGGFFLRPDDHPCPGAASHFPNEPKYTLGRILPRAPEGHANEIQKQVLSSINHLLRKLIELQPAAIPRQFLSDAHKNLYSYIFLMVMAEA